MSTVLLPNGPTELNPVDAGDAPSGGTSVDTMVVGVATRDPGAGLGVGDPGLAASADSGGTADVSGAKPPPPLG